MEIQMEINKIAETLFEYVPTMTPGEQVLSLSLYKRLAQGRSVFPADLADQATISIEDAESFLKGRFGVYTDKDGGVIGYLGLSISKMGYQLNINDKQLYTWCAWDSLFIPQLLGGKADVKSTDPNTGKNLEIVVAANGTASSNSGDVAMSVLIPQVSDKKFVAALAKDIISSFCHHLYFFESKKSAREFLSGKEEQYAILTLDEATELSRMWNEHVHGQALAKRAIAG